MSTYQTLSQTLQKIKRSEERLKVLIANKASLEAKVREKKIALDKENYDVEKLEGLSIEGFIHLIKGTLIEKLDKEEREAVIAKKQYDFACQELDVCLKEITLYRERVKDKFVIERDYNEFIKVQEAKMIHMNSSDAVKVKQIMGDAYYNTEIIREIREAIEAGDALKKVFNCIAESFEKAEDLGIIDVLENGLLVSDCGHEDVKNTNEHLVLIQQHIRKYHIEVLDVLGVCDVYIDNDRLLMFSDCFLERVMTGEVVAEKIQSGMDLIQEMIRHMDESIENLKLKKQDIIEKNNELKDNKILLIESYLKEIGGINEKSS